MRHKAGPMPRRTRKPMSNLLWHWLSVSKRIDGLLVGTWESEGAIPSYRLGRVRACAGVPHLHEPRRAERQGRIRSIDANFRVYWARPLDAPTFLKSGSLPLGIPAPCAADPASQTSPKISRTGNGRQEQRR
jgi:hypothetical protein